MIAEIIAVKMSQTLAAFVKWPLDRQGLSVFVISPLFPNTGKGGG